MPVTKYKDVSDMPRLQRTDDHDLIERIRAVWNRAVTLSPPDFERGVRRFRTIEQANQARAEALAQRMQRIARAKTE